MRIFRAFRERVLEWRKISVNSSGTTSLTDYGLKCAIEAYFKKHTPARDKATSKP